MNNKDMPAKCQNTGCTNKVGGVLVGIHRDMCPKCELEAQQRVAAYRALAELEKRNG